MRKALFFSAAALLALAASNVGGSTGLKVDGGDDFTNGSASQYSPVPAADSARWQVANGQLIGSGPAENSLLLNPRIAVIDGWIEAVSSRADDGGVVAKWQQDGFYYLLAFHDDGSPLGTAKNLAILRVSSGVPQEVWSGDVNWPRGTSHTVRLETSGSTIRASFDGTVMGQVTDTNVATAPGLIGFRTNGPDSSWKAIYDSYTFHVSA
jgi:hypothetical protein